MNVIEMGMFLTPVLGAVGGGTAVKTSGVFPTICGVAIGLTAGGIMLAAVLFLIRKLGNIPRLERFNRSGFALALVFLVPMSLPFVAYMFSHFIVFRLLHL